MWQSKKEKRLRRLARVVERVEKRLSRLSRISGAYFWIRWGVLLSGILTTIYVNHFSGGLAAALAGLFFTATFWAVIRAQHRIDDSVEKHRIWLKIKSTHIARMSLDWKNITFDSSIQSESPHPLEKDLCLTGDRSLCHLIDTTFSKGGRERLRSWLLNEVPSPDEIIEKQKKVREFIPLVSFRDRLALNGAIASNRMSERWDINTAKNWLEWSTPNTSRKPYVILLGTLSVANMAFFILNTLSWIPALWMITIPIYLLTYFGLYFFAKSDDVGTLSVEANQLKRTLEPFRTILHYLETYSIEGKPNLGKLCDILKTTDRRPSEYLKKVEQIAEAISWQQIDMFHSILNAIFPWDLVYTHRLNECKKEIKDLLPVWLDVWYEIEALNALANFAYLNPDTVVFPEIFSPEDRPLLLAEALGHPLLPDRKRKRNDFTMKDPGEIAIITGSNMSGKSTFLRTLGVNLRLAYAGGPVVASAFKTAPFRMFSCIDISDSVTQGISFFLAEVRRLKTILEEAENDHPLPVFFLIDEMYSGTNNRERIIGSRAYIQSLAKNRGVGLISTHDIELADLDHAVGGVKNYHFRERISGGTMTFDYRLRTGPCPTTNALKIMQMEGLPIVSQ